VFTIDVQPHPTPGRFTVFIRETGAHSYWPSEAIALAARATGIRIAGFSGYSYTLAGDRATFEAEINRLLTVAPTYTDLLLLRGHLPEEAGFQDFNADTDPEILRAWALAHYKACGINDRDSLNQLRYARYVRYFQALPLSRIRADQAAVAGTGREKVLAYATLREKGITFPPLILNRHYTLLEGYHRFISARGVSMLTHSAIRF
jgi:hypothetical protein